MTSTLIDLMQERAAELTEKPLFTYLDGDREEALSYGVVDTRARAIAAELVDAGLTGERVVLLYPPGLDFITAFLGCVYAGAVAVPAYPPNPARLERTLPRLRKVVENARASAFLTSSALRDASASFAAVAPEIVDKRWISSTDVPDARARGWKRPDVTQRSTAFVQYTSGSTGAPKGVVLTHGNLLHNESVIHRAFGHDRDLVGVGWLPLYHDMGLIGNVLGTVYAGGHCVLMSPLQFLMSPFSWLNAISRFRATSSGGPNFAYEMCVHKITPEQRDRLDLRSWKVAFNGAEPVRADTLDRFHRTFEPVGFRREAFLPCYGLAESSLLVSGELSPTGPTVATFDVAKLEIGSRAVESKSGDGRRLVGCGPPAKELDVRIVDAKSREALDDGEIGEIWVSGGSVAQGYYADDATTRDVFGATLRDAPGKTFLRTGDLGFIGPKGELFIAGRSKDVMIVRGRNYYPQDIERTAEGAHPALRPGCGAAFTIDEGDDVTVVVLFELDTKKAVGAEETARAAAAIREAIGDEHELRVGAVVLLKPGEIPKTSSGKVMRSAAQSSWRQGSLIALQTSVEGEVGTTREPEKRKAGAGPTEAEIVAFAIDWFANPAIGPSSVGKSLDALGLDSSGAVRFAGALSKWLGRKVPPTIFWDYPTIAALAKHLASKG